MSLARRGVAPSSPAAPLVPQVESRPAAATPISRAARLPDPMAPLRMIAAASPPRASVAQPREPLPTSSAAPPSPRPAPASVPVQPPPVRQIQQTARADRPAPVVSLAPARSGPAAPPFQPGTSPSNTPRPDQPTAVSHAPPNSAPPPLTLQGDITLDGARVGRWMASTLARQAARPAAGPTGPDPRQTPLWSGQAQGY